MTRLRHVPFHRAPGRAGLRCRGTLLDIDESDIDPIPGILLDFYWGIPGQATIVCFIPFGISLFCLFRSTGLSSFKRNFPKNKRRERWLGLVPSDLVLT